jgi:hypothetical protein
MVQLLNRFFVMFQARLFTLARTTTIAPVGSMAASSAAASSAPSLLRPLDQAGLCDAANCVCRCKLIDHPVLPSKYIQRLKMQSFSRMGLRK